MHAIIGLLVIAFLILLVVFGPILTIFSLNVLFGLAIAVSLKTWAATFWLFGLAGVGFIKFKR